MAQLKDTLIDGDLKINGKLYISDDYLLFNIIYPVGSLYWSSINTNPSKLFGFENTEWKAITNSFVYTADTSKAISDTKYGNKEIKLTVDQLPSHHHDISHTHTFKLSNKDNFHKISFDESKSSDSSSHGHNFSAYTEGSFIIRNYDYSGWGTSAIKNSEVTRSGNGAGDSFDQRPDRWSRKYLIIDNFTRNCEKASDRHSHTVSVSGSVGNCNFSGNNITTSNSNTVSKDEGGNSSINIMPPYIERYCWERIK